MHPHQQAPYVTIRAIQPVVAGLKELGYNTESIFNKVHISSRVLENADDGIPHSVMMTFWQEALSLSGDDQLGLHVAEATPIESLGVHTYASLSSPTLREAYHRACRYQRLIHDSTDLLFKEGPDEGILQHVLPDGRSVPRHPAEFLVTLWARFGKLISGENWAIRLVCFTHNAPKDISEHQRIFQTGLQFNSGRTAMHIANNVLDVANRGADLGLSGVLDDYAGRLLKQKPRLNMTSQSEHVRQQLLRMLTGGSPGVEEVAEALNMTVRTLQRNLSREGVTFSGLLNQLQHERATQYLADPAISITEVAFLLGFSEISSFYRAFKRWTGKTPAEFRVKKAIYFQSPDQSRN